MLPQEATTMTQYLMKKLDDQRKGVLEQLRAIDKTAADEKRELTADEQAKVTQASADMDAIAARSKELRDIEQANKDAEESMRTGLGDPEKRKAADPESRDLNAEFRSFLKGESRAVEIGVPEKRALAKSASGTGGATVPTTFYDTLVEHLVETSGVLLAGPTEWHTTGGEPIDVPVTTSHGGAGQEVAEGAAIPENDPVFGKYSLTAYKYPQLLKISRELVEDSAVDIEGYIAKTAGRNCGLALAPRLVTGTGSNQPLGIFTAATVGVTGASGAGGKASYEDLVRLFHSVIAPYRNSPSTAWILRDSTFADVRLLKDGAGQYIFAAGINGEPDRILNKPVYSDFSVPAAALGGKSIGFGDVSEYWVRFAGGVRFERSDDFAFNTDQITFKAVIRADATQADRTGAFKVYQGNAA